MISRNLPYVWDGEKLRRIHMSYDSSGGVAWVYVSPLSKEKQYAASPEGAAVNLARRLERERGWYRVRAIRD